MKEITNKASVEKEGSLKEGDIILRINSNSTDSLTLKEAKKLLDSSKERLNLVVRRDPPPSMLAPPDLTVKGMGMKCVLMYILKIIFFLVFCNVYLTCTVLIYYPRG